MTRTRNAATTPMPIARAGSRGRQARTTSVIASGASARGTQLTQARWAVSGRWRACGSIPTPNSPAANSTRERHSPGAARMRQMPTAATPRATIGRTTNQMNTWWGRSSIGSGHVDSRTPAAFWRKPSNSSHEGGRGSERPPRSRNTGSMNMPSKASPMPARARCTR